MEREGERPRVQRTTVSDVDGHYTFTKVPEGPAELRFELDGFVPVQRTIVVASAETVLPADTMTPAQTSETFTIRGLAAQHITPPR